MGNDILPPNMELIKLGIIILVFGAFAEAQLFGSMAGILGSINFKANRL